MENVLKKDLVIRISKRHKALSLKHTQMAVDSIIGQIMDALSNGLRIEIRDFGAFYLKRRPPRMVRNPKNGKTKYAPSRHQLLFKTGKELKNKINTKQ